jgi:hypothetical protein
VFRTTDDMLGTLNSMYNKEDVNEWILEEIERIDPNIVQVALENIWDEQEIEKELALRDSDMESL